MIKYALNIAFLLIAALSFGQESEAKTKTETTWDQERSKLKYRKKTDYKGPEDWEGTDPTSLKDNEYRSIDYRSIPGSGSRGSGGSVPSSGSGPNSRSSSGTATPYNPQQIQSDRQKRYGGFDRNNGGGNGTVKSDPKVKRPDPVESSRSPNAPQPTAAPDTSSSKGGVSMSFWKIFLYIIILGAVLVIVYYIMKRSQPPNKNIVVDVQNEWNPAVISKTELELKLEAAMEREDYRECVRIYFTFILKELINKGWIRWKKEKTNHHYVMELAGKPRVLSFMECVRIYDLVWYGDYNIDQDIFEMLRPTLESYYKSLDPVDEQ